MTSFDLPNNYTEDLEALLRKKRSRTSSSSVTPPIDPCTSATPIMAKTLHDYSVPAVANVPVVLAIKTGNGNFELHTGLITMVQATLV